MSRWGPSLFPATADMAAPKAKLVLLSGPSGVGKSELIKRLLEHGFECVRSYTTRAPRPGESEGNPYFFVSETDFLAKQKAHEFLIGQQLGTGYYGARTADFESLLASGKNVVFDMDPRRVAEVKAKIPHTISIALLPDSYDILLERMLRRDPGMSETVLASRLAHAKKMLSDLSEKEYGVDYWLLNPEGRIDETLKLVVAIATADASTAAKDFAPYTPEQFKIAYAAVCASLGISTISPVYKT